MNQMEVGLNASARIMYEEAIKRGIRCELLGDTQTILMEINGRRWYTRGSRTSFQSSVGKTIADIKSLTKKVLAFHGLTHQKYVLLRGDEDWEKVKLLTFPVVLKPIRGAHGKDVFVGIKNSEELRQAWRQVGGGVLVEEMFEGREYRVVCVDYKFVAAAYRKPAEVRGDGQHTIEELIEEKNRHPWRKMGHEGNLTKIEVDKVVKTYLEEQGLSLGEVPEKGRQVLLRKTANLSTGGEAVDVTDEVSQTNRRWFEQIARACDLNVVGLDIMCRSLKEEIVSQTKAGIIEVNASPGLRMHHFPMEGKPINVAGKIIDLALEESLK